MISATPTSLRMICSTKSNFSLLFLLILAISLLLLYTATYRNGIGTAETNRGEVAPKVAQKEVCVGAAQTERTEESTSRQFIYLTQTEQCLPAYLSSSRAIGDSKTCNCDVIVLSYREECQEEKLPHISYMLFRESTWTTGRNILYFVARERKPGYNYCIFLDDDVEFRFNSFAPQEMRKQAPFRVFEQWLLDYEPAIGVTDHFTMARESAKFILERRRSLCGIYETSMVVPVMWFDALFNAFHHKAIEHTLPYPTQYDKDSWWNSQLHVIYSAELKFRGQVLLFAPIYVHNPRHREYPRRDINFNASIREFVQKIQNRAPIAYRNRTLFEILKSTSRTEYFMRTTTYCMKTTRHRIVPYSHFDQTY